MSFTHHIKNFLLKFQNLIFPSDKYNQDILDTEGLEIALQGFKEKVTSEFSSLRTNLLNNTTKNTELDLLYFKEAIYNLFNYLESKNYKDAYYTRLVNYFYTDVAKQYDIPMSLFLSTLILYCISKDRLDTTEFNLLSDFSKKDCFIDLPELNSLLEIHTRESAHLTKTVEVLKSLGFIYKRFHSGHLITKESDKTKSIVCTSPTYGILYINNEDASDAYIVSGACIELVENASIESETKVINVLKRIIGESEFSYLQKKFNLSTENNYFNVTITGKYLIDAPTIDKDYKKVYHFIDDETSWSALLNKNLIH